ncbi:unnamed protein product, partial [Chrysoparadoxa australica]
YLQAFASLDSDKDGALTRSEFTKLLRKVKLKVSSDELELLWSCVDIDDEGEVSLEALLLLTLNGSEKKDVAELHAKLVQGLLKKGRKKTRALAHSVNTAFKKADSSGKGLLSEKPFRKCIEGLSPGMKLSSAQFKVLSKRFDGEMTGGINHKVFAAWLCSGLEGRSLAARVGRQLTLLQQKGASAKSIFRRADEDRSGELDASSFKSAIASMGLCLTYGQVAALAAKHLSEDGGVQYKPILALVGG